MLGVKQGSIKYHFLSLWYDSTWDWTQVSWAIGEHSNPYANVVNQRMYYAWKITPESVLYMNNYNTWNMFASRYRS